jgi:hypothetical protein
MHRTEYGFPVKDAGYGRQRNGVKTSSGFQISRPAAVLGDVGSGVGGAVGGVKPTTLQLFSSCTLVSAMGRVSAARKRPRLASDIRYTSPWMEAPWPGMVRMSPGLGGAVSRAASR